jgi:hypothetical protein
LTNHYEDVCDVVKTTVDILNLQDHPWPLVNLDRLNRFVSREVLAQDIAEVGVLTYVRGANISSFATFQSNLCTSLLPSRHKQYYGDLNHMLPGAAGNKTGRLMIQKATVADSTTMNEFAIMTYHFPPEDSCEVQSINFLAGDSAFRHVTNTTLFSTNGKTLISPTIENEALFQRLPAIQEKGINGTEMPRTYVMTAVGDKSSAGSDSEEAVAIVFANVALEAALKDMIPPSISGEIDVVFRNSCGQVTAYRISKNQVELTAFDDDGNDEWKSESVEYTFHLSSIDEYYEPNDCRITVVSWRLLFVY